MLKENKKVTSVFKIELRLQQRRNVSIISEGCFFLLFFLFMFQYFMIIK